MVSNWTMLFVFVLAYLLLANAHRGTRKCRCRCSCRRGCRR